MESRYEPEEKVKDVLSKSDELAEWLHTHAYDLALPDQQRFDLAVRSLYVALEHHKSIVLLSFNGYFASASALNRPLFEAFVNGLWIWSHASETELDYFVNTGRVKKVLRERVEDLEKNLESTNRLLSNTQRKTWATMCSYVHSGMEQLSRHKTANTIQPNFADNEIIELLIFANTYGLLAGIFMNLYADPMKRLTELTAKASEYDNYHESLRQAFNLGS